EQPPKMLSEIDALHRRCGVYTKPNIVRRILDAVGWKADADLSAACLLEPACGDGAFVIEAALRLVASLRQHCIPLIVRNLRGRITAYELHAGAAQQARARIVETLHRAGVDGRTSVACARAWVIKGDFLLSDLSLAGFSHIVGNPPYVRWSRIPPA